MTYREAAKGSQIPGDRQQFPNTLLTLVLAMLLVAQSTATVAAERIEPTPEELKQVTVTEHLDAQLPLDLPFVASDGKAVRLRDYFDGRRPVVMTLNYSNCPMLCNLQLTGLFQGLQGMPWNIGENFQMVTVSVDPKETAQRAELTKKKYLKVYGRPGGGEGWHFLVGREADIRKLAATVGFGYVYDASTQQYAHPAVTFICTPDGRVSRYLYGIEYDPQTLKLTLLEAAEGKIGSTLDRVVLYCFHYDADKGRYGPAAVKLMRVGGAAMLVVLAGMVAVFWRRGARRAAAQATETQEPQ
ncbi:MAG: SCO family protein [Thermoguttaceae bacterium]